MNNDKSDTILRTVCDAWRFQPFPLERVLVVVRPEVLEEIKSEACRNLGFVKLAGKTRYKLGSVPIVVSEDISTDFIVCVQASDERKEVTKHEQEA